MLLITSRSYVVVLQYTVFAFVLVRDSKKEIPIGLDTCSVLVCVWEGYQRK